MTLRSLLFVAIFVLIAMLTLAQSGHATPLTITITSPTNTTYNTTNISLEVSADEAIDTWWYSLNNGTNTTFIPNISITAQEGSNHLIVYGNNSVGNISSAEVWFTVALPHGYLTADQYNLLDKKFRTHMNYFLSNQSVTSYRLPLTAYKVGDRARYGYSNPTEWGYVLQAWIAGAEKGIITKDDAFARINTSLNTMKTLQLDAEQNYNGLFYPYYKVTDSGGNDIFPYHDTNHEIPSGDNALLYASLLITEGWARSKGKIEIANKAKQIKDQMNFSMFLFTDGPNKYIAHQKNADTSQLSSSKWDVYADEGGMVVLIAYFSDSVDFSEFKELINSQMRSSATWNNHTIREAAWFNAMFTWSVQSLGGYKVVSTPYSNDSFVHACKAHLDYGEWLGVDYPAFSDAMSQSEGGVGLVGRYTPPNLAGEVPTTPPKHTMPHAFFVCFNVGPDLKKTTVNTLVTKISQLQNDTAGYWHETGLYDFGFEVVASPYANNTTYAGADDGRPIFETLSESYTVLSLFNGLQFADNASTFYEIALNVSGYSKKVNETLEFLYSNIIPPTIKFIKPSDPDNIIVARNWTFLNVSVVDFSNVSACVLKWTSAIGTVNYTMTMLGSGTTVSCYINKTDVEGNYSYEVFANDSFNNIGSTNTKRIRFDTTPPTITIISPVNSTTYNISSIALTFIVNEPIDWSGYSLNGATNVTSGNTTLHLANGQYNITVYANDTTGNIGASNTVYFTINDTTAPTINITSPQNIPYEQGSPITIAYDSDEATFDPGNYSLDGAANETFVNGTTAITPGLGSHNITVWAKDASGNWGSDTENFTVEDTTAPAMTFVYPTPEDNANLSVTSITINVSHIEANPDTLVLNWNGENESYNSYSGSYTNITQSGLVNGTYTYYVWANDTSGNSNQTETRTITIDTVPPIITITSPTTMTYGTSTVNLKVSANETIDTWWYSLDGGANTTFTPNATLSELSNGQHSVIVYANDSAGNVGVGEIEVVIKSWSRTYDGGDQDRAFDVATDSSGNVYVTGFSNLGGNDDYYTIKYDSFGNVVWTKTYDGGDSDVAYGVAVDGLGNVYVTGASTLGGNRDYHTIKYDPNGNVLWTRTYDGGSWDDAFGVGVDAFGNVYVTGLSYFGGNDGYYTIKYDSSGNVLWNRTYDGGGFDWAFGVAADSSGNVYVTGASTPGGNRDYYTIKYDSSGNVLWNRTYDSGGGDEARDVAVDSSGNVYVAGFSGGNYHTIKYDSSGNVLWTRTYDGGSWDEAWGVTVDDSGNVYVTGWSDLGGNFDYYTIKYDPSGNVLWSRTYDGGDWDDAYGVAVDGSGNARDRPFLSRQRL